MPGSGKSTWGKKLASVLRYSFIDLDVLIEQNEQQSIAGIFAQKGEEHFRNLEYQYLLKTLNINNVVISCGGGTPCYNNNMNLINENGISIYLNAKKGILLDRILNAKKQRPLFFNLTRPEIEKKIEELLALRIPYYKLAQYSFDIPLESVQTFVNKASQLIQYNKK